MTLPSGHSPTTIQAKWQVSSLTGVSAMYPLAILPQEIAGGYLFFIISSKSLVAWPLA